MASTYSPNLRLELIGTGEQQGTWGATTNTNLGTLLEQAIGGYTSVTVSNAGDTTLTTTNGASDQSRNAVINLTGTISAARNVIVPAIQKVYIVKNATTGGYAVTFKVSGQTGVTIANGDTQLVYVDGTDVRSAQATLGTIATQNSNNVSITGGNITGLTNLAASNVAITGGNATGLTNLSASNVAITGGTITTNASGLSIRDADASNVLTIAVGSNLTANTVLTLTTGASSNRTLDISASNVTVSVAGAALIDDADAAAQRTTLGLGTANSPQFTAIELGNATDTTVARASAGVISVEGNHVPSPASQAQGDVLYHNGTTWARLGAGTSGQYLKTNGTGANPAWATVSAGFTSATSASASGTDVEFTGIPSTASLILVMLSGVSSNGSQIPLVQIGDSGGFETSGYTSVGAGGANASSNINGTSATNGYIWGYFSGSSYNYNGIIQLAKLDGNTWVASGVVNNQTYSAFLSGTKTLSDVLDRVRINGNGASFDAGTVNIMYI